MANLVIPGLVFALIGTAAIQADDPVFSGPQVGERLDPRSASGGSTTTRRAASSTWSPERMRSRCFWCSFMRSTRPSVALTRLLMTYAARHGDED